MKIKFRKLRKVGLRYLNVLMLSLLLVVQSVPSSVLISQAYAQEATSSNTTTATTTSSPASTPDITTSGNVGVGETTPPVDSGTPTITPSAPQNSATPSGQPVPTDTNNQTPPPVSEPQSPATPEASIQNQSNTSAPTSGSPANANAPSSTVNNSNPTPSPNSQTPPPTPPDDNKASLAAVVVKSGESNLGAILGAFSTSSAAESATLTTNKPDYSPTDTVLISGTGFKANHGYTLEVTSQDPPPVDFKTDITTKSDGTFVYAYQLDGTMRPNYTIYVKDGSVVVATTTFTDPSPPSASVDVYSQCGNGTGSGPTCNWTNGNLNSSNSRYFEADATPQRLAIQDLVNGDHTITIQYDTTQGGKHAYDFITNDKFSESWITDSDMCSSPISNLAGCSGLSATDSSLVPADGNAGGHDTGAGSARHFRIRNGTWVSGGILSGPTLVSGSYGGNSSTNVQLKFHVDTTTCSNKYTKSNTDVCEVLITFGAHVASEADWGAGNAAANINGSSYHVRIVELDGGAIGNRDNQMSANAVVVTTPTVTTAIHNANHQTVTSVSAGSIVHDSVTVTGSGNNPPTSTGTVVFNFFNNGTCSNTPAATSNTFTLSNGSVDGTTFTQGPLSTGSYSFNSHYNGDSNYTPADSTCEPLTVNSLTPAVATVIHDPNHNTVTSVPVGTIVHDNITVSGGNGTPSGTISLKWFTNSACSGNPAATSGNISLSNGTVDATGFTQTAPNTGGSFLAHYNGDNNYIAADGTCEQLTVTKINPTFTTTIHDPSHNAVTSVPAGSTIHDSANASGTLGTPTGTVDFTFYTGVRDCSNQGAAAGTGISLVSGIADPSLPEGALTAGSYSFRAHYNGDSNYNVIDSACEPLSVTKLSPTISTAPHPSGGNIGDVLNDSATLGGGYNATGNIVFNLYNPSDASCQSAPVYTPTVTVSGAGTYNTTPGFTSNASGTYHWTASYGGDINNNSVASGCADEPVSINKLNSSITTAIHNPNHGVVTAVDAGSTVHDSATVTGSGPTPTGNVVFSFYTTGSCTGDNLGAGTVALNGSGVADPSLSKGPLSAGSYSFKAHYVGDNNYSPSDSLCEPLTVNQVKPNVNTIIHLATGAVVGGPVALGSSVSDEADVTGSFGVPTGTVDFAFYTSGDCTTGLTSAGTGVPLNGSGIASPSSTEGPLTTGSYSFKAHYNGNINYVAGDSLCEPLTVNKADTTTTTQVHNADHQNITNTTVALGSSVHDDASVGTAVGNISITGDITYDFYTNNNCTGDVQSTETVTVGNESSATSALGAGNYGYIASYSGDSNYNSSTGVCEPFSVNQATPTVTTELHDSQENIITSETLDTSVHDKATVAGIESFMPTGSVDFTFYTGTSCDNQGVSAGSITLDENGIAHPSTTETITAGLYSFSAHYNGDANYAGANSACETFTRSTLAVLKQLSPTNDPGKFNLNIDGTTYKTDATNNDTTGVIGVLSGSHSVSETAGTGTNLTKYTSAISCTNEQSGSGTSLSTKISAGSAVTCTITNTRNTGTIKIVKNTSGGDGTFNFTVSGETGSTPQIITNQGTGASGPTTVNTGSYSVSETFPNGWTLASSSCTDGTNPLDPTGFNVATGKNIVCTFNDTKLGTIIVQKEMVGGTGSFTFTGDVGGPISQNGGTLEKDNVLPGTYTSVEGDTGGWDLTSISCNDPRSQTPSSGDVKSKTATFNVDPGETVTCTFTNTKRGEVIVTKYQDDNANGQFDEGESTLPNWQMTLDETSQTTGDDGTTTFTNLTPGSHTLSETTQDGWILSNINCNNEDFAIDNSNEHSVDVPAGGTINCYVGNYQDAHITVIKDVVDPNGKEITDTSTGFDFSMTDQEPFVLYDEDGGRSFDVKPGTYDISETPDANYSFAGCEAVYNGQSVGQNTDFGKTVTVNSGDSVTVTCTNKQKPGTVLGYKWNDLNGNGQFDEGEAKLSGWTIFADLNSNGTLDQGEPSTTTDNNGNYSLNLDPGSYRICEVGQNGWQQTYPINKNNNCHSVTLSSNETFDGSLNFGNQGHGKITVKKNVDTNGDGKVDILGATDWTYRIGEAGPYTTGSTQDVTAGSYTISEGSKDNYHLISWSCNNEQSGETNVIRLNVNAGGNITCTFFNARNTGNLKAQKVVDDQSALSAWSFSLDGGAAVAANNSGLVDFGQVTTGDTHTITESGPSGYQLVSITGTNCSQSGSAAKATVNQGSTTTCTFSNQAVKGSVSLQKITDPASDGTKFNFGLTLGATTVGSTSLSGKDSPFTFNNLKAGDYSITETGISDWDLTAVSCNVGVVQNGNTVTFSLAAAGNASCSFTNKAKRGKITVNKQTNPSGDNTQFFIDLTGSGTITGGGAGSISSNSSKDYEVTAGTYTVNETIPSGWTQTGNGCVNLVVAPGQSVSCTITNSRAAGVVLAASTGKILAATGAPTLWLFISAGLTALGAALMIAGKKLYRRK